MEVMEEMLVILVEVDMGVVEEEIIPIFLEAVEGMGAMEEIVVEEVMA